MVVKLDLVNAFNRLRHKFIFEVLAKFGFSLSFINWIQACIFEPWIAPLVNDRPTDFFKATRGLRQGCPISPMLFVLQASVLSFQLEKSDRIWTLWASGLPEESRTSTMLSSQTTPCCLEGLLCALLKNLNKKLISFVKHLDAC